MSHFSTIKTQLKEVKPLIKALDQLGYVVNQEKKFIKGYRGQFTAVDISMDLPSETKVGFKWDNNSNSYELVTDLDLWKFDLPVERFISKVTQMYAYHTIISKTEDLLTKNLQKSVVIRPSVILGNNDQFLSNLLPIFKMSFFIPLFGNGSKKFQPVLIDDIVEFVAKTIEVSKIGKQLYELAGPDIFTYREFYNLIADAMNKKRVLVPTPMPILKPVVGIAEKLPFFPINSEQLSLFETDNILKNKESGFNYFAISPKKVISAIKKSL